MFLLDVINNTLCSPLHNCREKPRYMKEEGEFTKKELNEFYDCKYPPGNILKELLRFNILLKRVIFRKRWNRTYGKFGN